MELDTRNAGTTTRGIPNNWDQKTLGEIAQISSGGTPNRSRSDFWGGDIPWVMTSQVDFCTIDSFNEFITSRGLENSAAKLFPEGTVLMAMYGQGPTRGKVAILGKTATTNQACAAILPEDSVSNRYLFYYLASIYKRIRGRSNDGSQKNLNGRIIKSIQVALPPLPEQRAIAEVLSDVDALIERLDALIAKKRAIKTAAMQRLLTGQQRLPGFSAPWTTKRLGEIGDFTKGKGIPKKDTVESGIPCVRYAELYTHHRDIIRDFVSFIPESVAENAQKLKKGDVLFAGSGETKEEIGMCAAYLGDDETYAGGDIVILSPKSENSRFLGYALNAPAAVEQKSSMAQGDAIVHLYARHLSELEIYLPPEDEQRAIANILSDMDAEIEALQARRDKTQAIKQGMMQELLTGRTRLVERDNAVREETRPSHNRQFDEAVTLGVLAKTFGSPEYPLARKRRTKLLYLFHRHTGQDTSGYLKKAAGPYNPDTRYGGPESIAQSKAYVEEAQSTKMSYTGFIAGEEIDEAESYFQKWYGAECIDWLQEHFRYIKTDKLGVLATVDMAMQELRDEGRAISVSNVKSVLKKSDEWSPKLKRDVFSDDNIEWAIQQSEILFPDND